MIDADHPSTLVIPLTTRLADAKLPPELMEQVGRAVRDVLDLHLETAG